MNLRRRVFKVRTWLAYRLDRFLAFGPLVQLAALIGLTCVVVAFWALLLAVLDPRSATGDPLWWSLTRFLDGGTMADDAGWGLRALALGATASGVLTVSLLTGAFASRLAERFSELRLGTSPVVERGHLLVLGHDAKVPLVAREIVRAHRAVTLVLLAQEEKSRLELGFRFLRQVSRARLRVVCRTGDPRSEQSLLRVSADRAATVLVVAPPNLDDGQALRWTLSTLLALRRAVGPGFQGRVVVETRRAAHASLLALVGEGGVAGPGRLSIEVVASDDIVARLLAQSVRHGGVYFALRELLSFRGHEFYLEPVPLALVGRTFDHAHARVHRGIAVGLRRAGEGILLAPSPEGRTLSADDQLLVLESDPGQFSLGSGLPEAPVVPPVACQGEHPAAVTLLGFNRMLPCLVTELGPVMAATARLRVVCPALPEAQESAVAQAARVRHGMTLEREVRDAKDVEREFDPSLFDSDAVVILGCEDEDDPDGDASALATLLWLRHALRARRQRARRLVTEVRDPRTAGHLASSAQDFLVSTDVVATVLAQELLLPEVAPAYRELLGPGGVELVVRPRGRYVPDGAATFAQAMASARRLGEVAIGVFPDPRGVRPSRTREQYEEGQVDGDEQSPVWLNPPRETVLPDGPDASLLVIARP